MTAKVIGNIITGMVIGFRDAVCGIGAIGSREQRQNEAPGNRDGRPKIIQRLIQCCLLNGGVFLLSLLLFSYVLLPGLEMGLSFVFEGQASNIWTWLEPLLSGIFGLLWVVPVFILTQVVNCIWFLEIAEQAYRQLIGRPQNMGITRSIVDSIFSYSVQIIFLIQSQLAVLFPIAPFDRIFRILHLSILYSLYAFEYKWCNQGRDFLNRVKTLEENLPYFVGFGMPLALMTSISESRLIAGSVFSILFPIFIISATKPVTMPDKMGRLRLFTPSLWLTNMIFTRYIYNTNISQQDTSAPPPISRTRVQRS